MGRLKILVVSERYWPDGSGGELATHLIVDVLSREFKVTVITGTKDPSKLSPVRYIYEPLLSKWEKPVLWFNVLKLVKTERFGKLLRESDVVYVPRFAFPVIPYAKRMGKKIVVHLHDYIPVSYTTTILAPYEEHKHRITRDDAWLECVKGLKYSAGVSLFWWLPRLARKWISRADRIVCVSERQAEIILDQALELKDKTTVVYNPLPRELLNAEPSKELDETPTFLYLGGDNYVKGFHILFQALRDLGKRGIKARFILTNTYNSRNLENLKRLREKYRSLEVQIVGRIKHEDIINLHRQAWGLIFPSIWEEPLPYAILESALCGTLPIASKVGGVEEVTAGSSAERFLFNPGRVNELTDKILLIVNNKNVNDAQNIGESIRNHVLQLLGSKELEHKLVRGFIE